MKIKVNVEFTVNQEFELEVNESCEDEAYDMAEVLVEEKIANGEYDIVKEAGLDGCVTDCCYALGDGDFINYHY